MNNLPIFTLSFLLFINSCRFNYIKVFLYSCCVFLVFFCCVCFFYLVFFISIFVFAFFAFSKFDIFLFLLYTGRSLMMILMSATVVAVEMLPLYLLDLSLPFLFSYNTFTTLLLRLLLLNSKTVRIYKK